jgi:hypothetical protein
MLADGEIKSGTARARKERSGHNDASGYPDAERRQRLQDHAATPSASAAEIAVAAAGRGPLGD